MRSAIIWLFVLLFAGPAHAQLPEVEIDAHKYRVITYKELNEYQYKVFRSDYPEYIRRGERVIFQVSSVTCDLLARADAIDGSGSRAAWPLRGDKSTIVIGLEPSFFRHISNYF